MNKKIIFIFLILTLLFTGCTITGRVVQEDTIKIGVILPLTGKAAVYGETIRNALELGAEELNKNGKKIQLVYEDERCDPKEAVNAYYSLVKIRGVKNIIGAVCSVGTLAIAPLAEKDKVILITPASAAETISQAGDYIFRNHGKSSIEMKVFADYASEKYDTYAIIYDSSNDGIILDKDYFTKYIEAKNGRVIFTQGFKGDETDFRTLLLRLREQEDNIDAIFLGGFQNHLILLIKQMNELGINKPILTEKTIERQDIVNVLGELSEGIIYAVADYDENTNPEFWNKYVERYNENPPIWAAQAYDNLMILSMIFEKCDFDDTDCIKDELYKVKDYPGVAGITSFDENGDAVKNIVIKEIRNGKFVKIT